MLTDRPRLLLHVSAQLPRLTRHQSPGTDTMIQAGMNWDGSASNGSRSTTDSQAKSDQLKTQAEGFYNTLSAVRRFNWGDDAAWDVDFE